MGKRTEIEAGDGDKERFGPVLRLTALAATLLALGAVIGPRLASSGGGGSGDSSTAAASLPSATTTSAPITSTSLPEAVATTSPTVATTTTFAAASPSTTAPLVVPAEDPDTGAVDLALIGVHAGRYGAEQSGFVAGDTIGWHFRVTNAGGEYLWGVFVYLEIYGRGRPATSGAWMSARAPSAGRRRPRRRATTRPRPGHRLDRDSGWSPTASSDRVAAIAG